MVQKYPDPIPNYASASYGEDTSWDIPEPMHYDELVNRSSAYSWDIRPHRHDSLYQLFLLTRGKVTISMDGSEKTYPAPVIIFVPPLCVHGFSYEVNSDGHVLTILDTAFHEFLAQTNRLLPRFQAPFILSEEMSRKEFVKLDNIFKELAEEFHHTNEGRLQLLYSHTTRILISTARLIRTVRVYSSGKSDEQHLAKRFTDLIDEHYQEHRNNKFYAASLGISEAKLTRISNSVLGNTPRKIMNNRLFLEAKRSLIYTNQTCAQIGYKLGFSDPAYFNRFFKKHTDQTPAHYREISTK